MLRKDSEVRVDVENDGPVDLVNAEATTYGVTNTFMGLGGVQAQQCPSIGPAVQPTILNMVCHALSLPWS